ncbi:MAG TPA: SpvB/TcaC N-terminal domain-containing protein [Flavipsychrobacter sp.]|nr:SpvB/TcaC N-terminal domain-containing protein [Flavipsychrobacter sp.]
MNHFNNSNGNGSNSGGYVNPFSQGSKGGTNPLEQYSRQPEADKKDDSPFYKSQAPAINLPKGGGALKGIDEKFSVNAINGTASLDIPLPITPGRGGFTPSLSLNYNSGSGNSEFGLGWSLSLPSIQRKTDKKLPRYDDANESDVFLLAGAEDLVPELDNSGDKIIITWGAYTIKRYRPRIEGLFARIEHIRKAGSPGSWWRVTTKDNITTYYGLTAGGRIADPKISDRVCKWLPQLVVDHKGNAQEYDYIAEDDRNVPLLPHERNRLNELAAFANVYLKGVRYCNKTPYFIEEADGYEPVFPSSVNYLMETVLDYGDHSIPQLVTPDINWHCRNDAFSSYQAGFEIRTYRLCKRILQHHHFDELDGNSLVRALELTYQYNDPDDRSLKEANYIITATQRGYEYKDSSWHDKTLPSMSFDYEPLEWNTEIKAVVERDFSGAPQGLTTPYQWIDFEGEGISGILTEQGTGWFYKNNLGDGNFTPPKTIAPKPSFTGLADGNLQWQDLDADGGKQIVTETPAKGFWELDDDQKWQSFRNFKSNLNIDWNSPYTKMLDLNGDGKADVLVTEDRVWTWYENLGKEGFDQGGTSPVYQDEEKGPVLLLRDNVQSIFLANMSGSGMTDLVRIKNGEICYWANMGYGKFGAKVTMSHAPVFHHPDLYNPQYLTLADISGTGAADLIYIGQNKCTAWINLSGNGWSEAMNINPLPATNSYNKIAVLDFLGNGTGCIVWSSPLPQHAKAPLQYIDLMGGKKPYLMRSYNNGMGKTVSVAYKSSTQFYLADKLAGNPWVTRLPFPVHCIENITTSDSVSETSFTQTYRYRHGYYDHEEREFRGFGYVETLDIDTAIVSDHEELDQPPVLTKTWYHTGAWIRKGTLLEQFKKEYFRFDGWDDVTKIADFPTGMNAQEQREVYRALKGLPLRQEVYAQDGTALQDIPYTVTASAYTVERVQSLKGNRFACFFAHPQQSIVFNCERDADDPRIVQELTLETDAYGNVLQSAQVVYPRKHTPAVSASYPQEVEDEQLKMHITYSQHSFTNDVIDQPSLTHHYRLRLPFEAKSFELLGLTAPIEFWTVNSLLDELASITSTIDFSATASGGKEKRLLSHTRTLYKDNDAAVTPLALGSIESLALPHEQYQLAFTGTLLTHCYGTHVTSAMMDDTVTPDDGGGYIDLDSDGDYWLPSGKTVYTDATYTDPAQQFYTPLVFTDPWDNLTEVSYWSDYWLLPEQISDAKGNVTSITAYDWRCLQPVVMKDMNDNYSEILYDTLCMPVALALKGKGSQGDTLIGIDVYDTIDGTNQQQFFSDDPYDYAADLLQGATWRCVYDFEASPAVVGMIARQHHVNGATPLMGQSTIPLVRLSYTDGFGRVIMHKAQAAPATPLGALRWIGSGRTVYNNKGKAVMQFEPYFSTTHECDTAEQADLQGVSPKLFYDPLGRVQRTELPDGSYAKTEWTAWQQTDWDNNDTVSLPGSPGAIESDWYSARKSGGLGGEEQAAAAKAFAHADTPTTIHLDAVARPFYTIQQDSASTYIHSYVNLDMVGNRIAVIDGRGNMALSYRYNLLKQPCRTDSVDSGTQLILTDAAGQPLYSWDADDREFRMLYDELRRPVEKYIDTILSETMSYGEGQASDKANNLRGQLYRQQNGGGEQTVTAYDFKGNPLETEQRLLSNATTQDVNLATASFSAETFNTTISYDALNRTVSHTIEKIAAGTVLSTHMTENMYDEAGALIKVTLNGATYVQDIHYDAKGQRGAIWYGNGTKTSYTYDAFTFRLRTLFTVNVDTLSPHYNQVLQDLYYYYDPVGNITTIENNLDEPVYYNNSVAEPHQKFTYDALYRLTIAAGRELVQAAGYTSEDTWVDAMAPSAPGSNACRNYTQTYTYDAVGNITELQHSAGTGSYTRTYTYPGSSNRLSSNQVGSNPAYSYTHDTRGNMIDMPHLSAMDWNNQNQLSHITRGTTEAYYQYSNGQRIRKYVDKVSEKEERIFLGNYEVYRKYNNSNTLIVERETVHVSDDTGRIAMLEVRTQGNASDDNYTAATLTRYIYSNHLQSASLELDGSAAIISYEEYHPYGTTAYQAADASINAVAKRYRYTGKERDEESGLYYHGARYYVPWLCRWSAVDPSESKNSPTSSYVYCSGNPVNKLDPDGKDEIHFYTFTVTAQIPDGYGGKRLGIIGQLKWTEVIKNDSPNTYTEHSGGYELDNKTGKQVNEYNKQHNLKSSEVGEAISKNWSSLSRSYGTAFENPNNRDRNKSEVIAYKNNFENRQKENQQREQGIALLLDIATLGEGALLIDKLLSKGATALIGKTAFNNGVEYQITKQGIKQDFATFGSEFLDDAVRMTEHSNQIKVGLAEDFLESATKPWGDQGLTVVGRALQKHAGREGSVFQEIKFSHKTANKDALNILNQMMNSKSQIIQSAENGGTLIFDKTTGRGFGVSREGLFNGFRELPKK